MIGAKRTRSSSAWDDDGDETNANKKTLNKNANENKNNIKEDTQKQMVVKIPTIQETNVRTLIVSKIMSDDAIEDKEGHFMTDTDFSIHVENEDVDCYTTEGHLLFKFRKGVIPPELCALAVPCFKKAAKHKHFNRGPSSGLVSLDRMPSYVKELVNPSRYRSKYISQSGKFVNWDTGNVSHSNIIGYFDAANNFRSKERHDANVKKYPCRTTAFTRDHRDLWEKGLPLIKHVDSLFRRYIPDKYAIQHQRGHRTPFMIDDTAFSTITINYNWQTAVHVDAGDFRAGFGNFAVFQEGEYQGGKLGFPQYGVCVDVRMGDYLAMDVHAYHCNTPIQPMKPIIPNTMDIVDDNHKQSTETAKTLKQKNKKKDTKDDNDDAYTRLSMVFYLRERMVRCEGAVLDS